MKIHNFRGDLTDISDKTEALVNVTSIYPPTTELLPPSNEYTTLPPQEGDDGVPESAGVSSGTPSFTVLADGVYEGAGESATPSSSEGADGVLEGAEESAGTTSFTA